VKRLTCTTAKRSTVPFSEKAAELANIKTGAAKYRAAKPASNQFTPQGIMPRKLFDADMLDAIITPANRRIHQKSTVSENPAMRPEIGPVTVCMPEGIN
jgi:hypothetical protein